jgi:prepilin-type N-terminal cleavage/methylation domain-containing protein
MHDFSSNFSQREKRGPLISAEPARRRKNTRENMKRSNRTKNQGFTIVELIVVITVIGLLAAIAVGAYNKVVNDAKVAKSTALISTLATAKSLFVADPKTTPQMIQNFNGGPDTNFNLIAPYLRVNGYTPQSEQDLLNVSGFPQNTTPPVAITLGTVDDSSFGGTTKDVAPTVTGYGLPVP